MTTDDECIHGLGPVSACVICNGRAKREQDTRPAPRTFPAKYASRCFQCDQQIDEGDIVAWLPGERATHENCWDDQ